MSSISIFGVESAKSGGEMPGFCFKHHTVVSCSLFDGGPCGLLSRFIDNMNIVIIIIVIITSTN